MKGEIAMSDSRKPNYFPSNKIEALAMLYLKNQDLSDISPELLVDRYEDAYRRINQRFSDIISIHKSVLH